MLTLFYMMKSFHVVFLGESRGESHAEGVPVMVTVVAILAGLTILTSILLQLPYHLASVADGERLLKLATLVWR